MKTAWDSVTDSVDGLQAGADDYLLKPFDLRELASTPAHAVAASGGALRQPDRTRPFDHNRRMGKPYPCASEVDNGQRRLTDY